MNQNCPELHSSVNYCTCDMDRHTQKQEKKDEKNSKSNRKKC